MTQETQRIVGLVSGGSSTMADIVLATQDGRLPRSEVVGVISSNPSAITPARIALFESKHIPIIPVFPPTSSRNKAAQEAYGEQLLAAILPLQPDIVGQWGHMPLTPEIVVAEFEGRMINQHPGPIDPSDHDFGGRGMSNADRVHTARLLFVDATQRNFWTEVTAQRVEAAYDGGRVLKRGRVEIFPEDTFETLGNRAIVVERETQVALLQDFEAHTVTELPPYDDLVLPTEYALLRQVKREAIRRHPTVHE